MRGIDQAWYRRPIFAAIISSTIATAIIEMARGPGAHVLSAIIAEVITPFYHGYVDSQYQQAAADPVGAMIYGIFLAAAILPVTIVATITASDIAINLVKRSARKSLGEGADLVEIKRFARARLARYPLATIRYTVLFTMCLAVFPLVSTSYVSLQAHTSYDIRFRALVPYMTEQEQKTLTGLWARVQSRADYDRVIAETARIAAAHKVTVPCPLI